MDAATVKWNKAEQVERQLLLALEALQEAIRVAALDDATATTTTTRAASGLLFPSIRECNAALATFGDRDELLRALRLFMKMRKANVLRQQMVSSMGWSWPVPSPTLVTYSTIMSRANRGGKPRVALRMWKLMQNAPEFSTTTDNDKNDASSSTTTSSSRIVPDIKAANILMNSYAKLADIPSARDVLQQMKHGHGKDVPRLQPNLITYNTLLDACHKAGDLDAALDVMNELEEPSTQEVLLAGLGDDGNGIDNNNNHPHLTPDAWSYTSLIATVARKPSKASGVNDPSLAFEFLEDMKARKIRPNGMTYSALIDVCGRCKRADMALQGLRIMLRQKAEDREYLRIQQNKEKQQNNNNNNNKKHPNKNPNNNNNNNRRGLNYKGKPENYSLPNEVGAWTAAINALGKEGRLRAAMRLFKSMPQFGVQPNAVTCGCLTDSLVKHGCMADALEVLRFMEDEGITPSEIMYTSLMSSAGDLAQLENKNEFFPMLNLDGDVAESEETIKKESPSKTAGAPVCSAIEVYTVLMKSLMEDRERNKQNNNNNNNGNKNAQEKTAQEIQEANAHSLMKVFLVFQEMKESGAQPDLACYNALLRACARVGDINRAQSVFKQLQEDSLEPNDTSWRQLIRAAGKAKRVDIVISTWKMAMDYSYDIKSHLGFNSQLRRTQWIPSSETVATMITALLRRAGDPTLEASEKRRIYHKIVVMYLRIISGNKDEQLGMHRVDSGELQKDTRAMLLILQAIVNLERLTPADGSLPNGANEKRKLHFLATRILDLEALQGIHDKQRRLSRSNLRSLSIAQSWIDMGFAAEALRP